MENPRYKKFAFLTALIVGLGIVTAAVLFINKNYLSKSKAAAPKVASFKSFQQLQLENKVSPPEQILEISLSYNKNKNPQIEITGERILNGYPEKQVKNTTDTYILQLSNGKNETIEEVTFDIPLEYVNEYFPKGKKEMIGEPGILTEQKIRITVPLKKLSASTKSGSASDALESTTNNTVNIKVVRKGSTESNTSPVESKSINLKNTSKSTAAPEFLTKVNNKTTMHRDSSLKSPNA